MQPLHAHSPAEAHLYLKVTACPQCGKGPWDIQDEPEQADGQVLRARCMQCGLEQEFAFECPSQTGAAAGFENPHDLPAELINPAGAPSQIIDLGQWLSLFHLLVESANRSTNKQETRRQTFQAAQCLDEALRFYSEELPPVWAFFTESSSHAYAKHPERFSRQKLLAMRSKLPDIRVMTRRLRRDAHSTPRRWWQFWK